LFGFWLFKPVSWIVLFLIIVANFTHLYNYYCRNKTLKNFSYNVSSLTCGTEKQKLWVVNSCRQLTWLVAHREEKKHLENWKLFSFSFFFIRKIVLFLIFSFFFSFGSLTFVRRTFLLWNDSVKRLLILWFTSLTSSFDSSILNPIWLIVSLQKRPKSMLT
jgi:hypothetical protein